MFWGLGQRSHAVKQRRGQSERMRIPEGAGIGLQMRDQLFRHQKFHALKPLVGFTLSVTLLFGWHVFSSMGMAVRVIRIPSGRNRKSGTGFWPAFAED